VENSSVMERDIRDEIFRQVANEPITAVVSAEADGMLFGLDAARRQAMALGLTVIARAEDGKRVRWGDILLLVHGFPKAIAQGEEVLIGAMAKPSGIATAAAEAVRRAGNRLRVVSGAWKKMPLELKATVRGAIQAGGASFRIVDTPFLYLDKNYQRILGGIRQTLEATAHLTGYSRVIQLRGEQRAIAEEVAEAVTSGADILMIDTGDPDDIDRVAMKLRELGLRDTVRLAFAGGISLNDIETLSARDVDILDVGTAIVDAPLLPLRFDVIPKGTADRSLEFNLLEKTELWIRPIHLQGVNLQVLGHTVAEVLELGADEVLVTDVREQVVTLDILRRTVMAEQIVGKERTLLTRLAAIPGVGITEETGIHSEGVLGLIALGEADVVPVLEGGRDLRDRIQQAMARRVMVFPTGGEVQRGIIRDTNTDFIATRLRQHGFRVATGSPLPDEVETISGAIRRALGDGYGLVITTGGIGAEDKDQTVEAILRLDPDAATPYIVRFPQGSGRHVKDGVRIAVGQFDEGLIVGLPGPHEEVQVGLEVLLENARKGITKSELAEALAARLRVQLREKMARHHH
jgi:molybdenum cofactor synthesis domain-containing protein